MPAKRIPQLNILTGATSATDDKVVIFDADGNETKAITRQELGKGIVGDLPYTPAGGISATTVPTAIAELDTEAAKSAALAANSGSSLVGYTQGGTGAQTTTVQAKLRETVSVKDFGAVGDGVTDDTAAIQAAIDYALSSNIRNVYAPAGTYNVTEIVISDVSLYGDGQRATRFIAPDTASFVIQIDDSTDFCTFRNFGLAFNSSSATGVCLLIGNDIHNNDFVDLEATYGNHGIFNDTDDTHFMCCYTNVRVNNTNLAGFRINSLNTSSTTLSFRNCYCVDCPIGFQINNCKNLTMESCAVDVATQYAFFLTYCAGNILSSHIESASFTTTNHAVFRLFECDGLNIDSVVSESNSTSAAYYSVLILNGPNKNIRFANLQSAGNTNEQFLYVDSSTNATNSNLIVSGVSASLVSVLVGDIKIRNPDYESMVFVNATDALGEITQTYPTVPDYLNFVVNSFVDDGYNNYYVSTDRFSGNFKSRIKNPDGTNNSTAGVLIKSVLTYYRN